eukprot:612244-Rhodomonas_salina.1
MAQTGVSFAPSGLPPPPTGYPGQQSTGRIPGPVLRTQYWLQYQPPKRPRYKNRPRVGAGTELEVRAPAISRRLQNRMKPPTLPQRQNRSATPNTPAMASASLGTSRRATLSCFLLVACFVFSAAAAPFTNQELRNRVEDCDDNDWHPSLLDCAAEAWDTSEVTDMEGLFGSSSFNGNIANWNVSA